MRNPPPAPAPDTADRTLDRVRQDHLAAPDTWLDALKPFVIEWELIWPM
jgi:hypothetical protein